MVISQTVRRRSRRRGGGVPGSAVGSGGTLGSVVNSLVVNLGKVVAACAAVAGFGRVGSGRETQPKTRVGGSGRAAPGTSPEHGWRRARSVVILIALLSVLGAIFAAVIGVTVFTVNLLLRHGVAGAGG